MLLKNLTIAPHSILTIIGYALITSALSACMQTASNLTLAQKAGLISEQLMTSQGCAPFIEKLKMLQMTNAYLTEWHLNEDALNQIYVAASAAHCIKSDI